MRFILFVLLLVCCAGQSLRDPSFVSIAGRGAGQAYTPPAGGGGEGGGENGDGIIITNNGIANPYASVITIVGTSNTYMITNLTVTISNLTHTRVSDLRVEFQDTNAFSSTIWLMSGDGGANSISDKTLTFSTFATQFMASPPTNGTYWPDDGATALDIFRRTEPVRTWALWVKDLNATASTGFIPNWSVHMDLVPTWAGTVTPTTTNVCYQDANTIPITVSGSSATPFTFTVFTTFDDTETTLPGNLGITNQAITGTPTNTGTFPSSSYKYYLRAIDTNGAWKYSGQFQLNVHGMTNSTTLPIGSATEVYSNNLGVTANFSSPYFYVSDSNLLAGLSLTTNGILSGTVTNASTNTFTVTVTNSLFQCSRTFLMQVAPLGWNWVTNTVSSGGNLFATSSMGTVGVYTAVKGYELYLGGITCTSPTTLACDGTDGSLGYTLPKSSGTGGGSGVTTINIRLSSFASNTGQWTHDGIFRLDDAAGLIANRPNGNFTYSYEVSAGAASTTNWVFSVIAVP